MQKAVGSATNASSKYANLYKGQLTKFRFLLPLLHSTVGRTVHAGVTWLITQVWRTHPAWRIITALHSAPNRTLPMSTAVKISSFADVYTLAKGNIIRYDRDNKEGLVVAFRSKLTSHVVDEIQRYFAGKN
jgi:hypothetical protein